MAEELGDISNENNDWYVTRAILIRPSRYQVKL